MNEKILDIVEGTFKQGNWYSSYDGYIITTDKQIIKFGISNGQGCCENWGYFMSEDKPEDFIGSTLLDIKVVDTCLNPKGYEETLDSGECSCMFINLETDKGTLQFVAYNEHNGYYGHEAVLISRDLNEETCL